MINSIGVHSILPMSDFECIDELPTEDKEPEDKRCNCFQLGRMTKKVIYVMVYYHLVPN